MTCQLSAISHECWDSVWSSFHQEKIRGLIDDVCHVSIRNAQQPSLRAPSLHKDYIYWGLEHIFFQLPRNHLPGPYHWHAKGFWKFP